MHRKRARRILGILKKSISWVLPRRKTVDFRLLAEAGPVALWRVPHVLGGRWKSQKWKNMYLSPYVEKPLNSKVIKCFVPELRSRKCFSCFRIPMFYVYMLWTFYVRFPYSCMGMVHQDLSTYTCHTDVNSCQNRILFWARSSWQDVEK